MRPALERAGSRAEALSSFLPAVLIMARAPRRGEVRHALEPLIGLDGCVALQTALLRGGDALGAVAVPARAVRRARSGRRRPRSAAAGRRGRDPLPAERRRHRRPGGRRRRPRLGPLIRPDRDRLARPCRASARSTPRPRGSISAAGADLVLGPVFDGGYYLIALARPLPSLFALPEQVWRGPDSFNQVLLGRGPLRPGGRAAARRAGAAPPGRCACGAGRPVVAGGGGEGVGEEVGRGSRA